MLEFLLSFLQCEFFYLLLASPDPEPRLKPRFYRINQVFELTKTFDSLLETCSIDELICAISEGDIGRVEDFLSLVFILSLKFI